MTIISKRMNLSGLKVGPKKPVPEIVPPKRDTDNPDPNRGPEMPPPSRTPESERPAGGDEIGPGVQPIGPEMPTLPDMPEVGIPPRDLH